MGYIGVRNIHSSWRKDILRALAEASGNYRNAAAQKVQRVAKDLQAQESSLSLYDELLMASRTREDLMAMLNEVCL